MRSEAILSLMGTVIFIGSAVGWVINIFKLVQTNLPLAQWTVEEVVRAIGIPFAPLGAVMGYFSGRSRSPWRYIRGH
jgi:hypothetical protein